MTNWETINIMIEKLKKANQNDEVAFFIFFHFTNIKNKLDLINHKNQTCERSSFLIKQVEDYIHNKPLAKILGESDFYGLKFIVKNEVFSPRLDTEILVETVLNKIKNKKQVSFVDVCTGTGIIGLSILKNSNNINKSYLIDLNPYAVENAQINADILGIKTNIIKGNLLDYLIDNKIKLDVLISNPPYISYDEKLEDNVDYYDPKLALYAEENGLAIYKKLLLDSRKVLNPNSYLIAFEIGYLQAENIERLAKNILGENIEIEVIKDINHLDRVVTISHNF